jgi:hypothetical protein
MKPNIIFRKSNQLSIAEIQQFRDLFFRVFEKKMDERLFERKYLYTPKGYSCHGLMLHEGAIVGIFNAIPYRYTYFGRERMFALSVDTMIAPEYRGGGHLVKMADLVCGALISDGISFIFGFPNEYFYRHEKRVLGTRDIGELDYYVLPINIGVVIPKLKLLNCFSRGYSRIMTILSKIPREVDQKYNIAKTVDEKFERHRYDASYNRIALGDGGVCIYKIYEEDKIRTLYIIDIFPLTPAFFAKAVKQIYKNAAGSIDIIIYVGKLPFRPVGLLKVPDSKKPQRIRITGKILIPELVDDSVFAIENWSLNISNFDVR